MARRWCAYLLWCSDGSLYAGMTCDLGARLEAHNSGKGARYTRSKRPVRLARAFWTRSRSAALKREAALKALSRAEKLALAGYEKSSPRPWRSGRGSVRGESVQRREKTPGAPWHRT